MPRIIQKASASPSDFDFVSDLAAEMADIAERAGQALLAHLCFMVAAEAARISGKRIEEGRPAG